MLPLKLRKGHCVYRPYRKNACFSWLAGEMSINCMYIDFRKLLFYTEKTSDISRHHHYLSGWWRLKNKRWRSILMTCHYPGSYIWLDETNYQPIGSAAQMWTVTRHQCGITALVSKTSFRRATSGVVPKCRLFSLDSSTLLLMLLLFCFVFLSLVS